MLGARAWQANPRYGKVPSINSFQISPTLLGKGELKDFFNYLTLQYFWLCTSARKMVKGHK